MRDYVRYTEPLTIVHGYVLKEDQAVFCTFELEGRYLKLENAERIARRDYDPTFCAQSIDHASKRYEMNNDDFKKVATRQYIREKGKENA